MSRSCAVCGTGNSVKICGGCKDRCYCSAECQRNDWKTHKTSCRKKTGPTSDCQDKDFDPADMFAKHHLCQFVPTIVGKGGGVVATAFISAGEIIVSDRPILYISEQELGVSDIWSSKPEHKIDQKHALVKRKFAQLSEMDQAKVLSLEDSQTNNKLARAITDRMYRDGLIKSPWDKLYTLSAVPSRHIPDLQDPGYKSPEGVFQTNSLPVGDSNSLGLFPLISRFNHSCCPNAGYRGRAFMDEEVQVVQAMRDIQSGEEICVSYFNGYFTTSDGRQKQTMMSWGFQCRCEACQPAGLQEVRALVQSLDDGHMSDEDMTALVGPEKMALVLWKFESDQRRQRLNDLNTRLNTASSLAMAKRIVEEMDCLYRQEKILPHLLVEVQIALDFLQAQVTFRGSDIKKWCKKLYDAKLLLAGEDNPKTKKAKEWLSRTPSIMEVVDFASSSD
ncbi:set5 [Symbiodinium sp. CCMP2592]|nr:set5 [Symbiodinium sp. CCMP2592]